MESGLTDKEVLQIAQKKGLVLLTADKDFGGLTANVKKRAAYIKLPNSYVLQKTGVSP